jgi:hypothetical protein
VTSVSPQCAATASGATATARRNGPIIVVMAQLPSSATSSSTA